MELERQRLQQQLQRQRPAARQLYEQLMQLADNDLRVACLRGLSCYQVWALGELLCVESRRLWMRDPRHAAELAALAVEVVWHLDAAGHGGPLLNDLQARAWMCRTNAERGLGDLGQAEQTLAMVRFFVRQGSGDPRVQGEALELEAALRHDQRRLNDAAALLDEAQETVDEDPSQKPF